MLRSAWLKSVSLGGLLLCLTIVSGCAQQKQTEARAKEITEEISQEELTRFLSIVRRLPGKKLPAIDSPFAIPTSWGLGQEKSIERLTSESLSQLEQRWLAVNLTPSLMRNPRLRWALASAQMSPEEFSGLVLSIGVSLSKSSLPEDYDAGVLQKRAREGLRRLHEDTRSLAKLPNDEQYQISQQSLWIPLNDLLTHYPMVPDDNLQLAKKNREQLQAVFPVEFSENPLKHYDKILNSSGLPFEDLRETGITDLTSWNPEESIRLKSRQDIESEHHQRIDEAFTPPDHLFGSSPDEIDSAQKSEEAKSAENIQEINSASNAPDTLQQ